MWCSHSERDADASLHGSGHFGHVLTAAMQCFCRLVRMELCGTLDFMVALQCVRKTDTAPRSMPEKPAITAVYWILDAEIEIGTIETMIETNATFVCPAAEP